MSKGYVYILTNDSMPGLVKIGRTSREVELRASELWQTGVPSPFQVFWSCKTPDCVKLEAYVHGDLRKHRVSKSREFFQVDPDRAVESVRLWAEIQAQEWAMEAFSEFAVVHLSCSSAASGVSDLASESGLKPITIADALSQVKLEELRPAIDRVLSQRRQEQIELFKEIGIPEEEWEGLISE